jgi:hypothetical protein
MLWLAEDCLNAGLKVVQLPGWETRGAEFPAMPTTVICHHTATPAKARGDLPSKPILIDGRSDLPGPLCQVALGRNGTVYLVASGKANHAGKGAWKGLTSSAQTLGIEAEHPGVGPWPDKQYRAYVLLVAVLLRGLGQKAERCCGHKDWALPAGRKTDPNFDMGAFRTAVRNELAALNAAHQPPAPSTKEWDEMATKEELRAVIAEEPAKAVKTLHDDHVVLLRGTPNHPYNLTSIGQAVVDKP